MYINCFSKKDTTEKSDTNIISKVGLMSSKQPV